MGLVVDLFAYMVWFLLSGVLPLIAWAAIGTFVLPEPSEKSKTWRGWVAGAVGFAIWSAILFWAAPKFLETPLGHRSLPTLRLTAAAIGVLVAVLALAWLVREYQRSRAFHANLNQPKSRAERYPSPAIPSSEASASADAPTGRVRGFFQAVAFFAGAAIVIFVVLDQFHWVWVAALALVCIFAALLSRGFPKTEEDSPLVDAIARKVAKDNTHVDVFPTKKGDVIVTWSPQAGVEHVLGAFVEVLADDEKQQQAKASRAEATKETREKIGRILAANPDIDLKKFEQSLSIHVESVDPAWHSAAKTTSSLRELGEIAKAEEAERDELLNDPDFPERLKKKVRNRRSVLDDDLDK